MRVAVVGAEGVLGRGVAARLVGLAHEVVGVGSRRPESWPGSVDFVVTDGQDPAAVKHAVAGADAVLLCTPEAAGLPAGLEAMTGRLVVASSTWAADVPRMIAVAGRPVVHVRTALVLGRFVDDAVLRLFAGPAAVDVDGSADRRVQVVHPHDVVRVLARAVLDPDLTDDTVDVAADGHTTVRAIAAALGRPVVAIPRRLRRFVAHRQLQTARLVRELPILDPTRLRDGWGITPAFDATQTVEDFALACRGRVAIGTRVHAVPWRLPRVLEVPAVDAPSADGIAPVPAGPSTGNGEFDTPIDPRFPAFIATNLSEALPGPFSPSSASVSVLGTRAAGLVISQRLHPGGAVQREMSVRTTGVFGHRLYTGITTGHFMAHTVPFIDPAVVVSGFFGHTEEGLELFGAQLPPVAPRGFARQLRGGLTFANCLIGLSAGSSRDTRDFAGDVERLESLARDPAGLDDRRLRELILLGRDHVVQGWVLASASILLCAGYGVVMRVLCGHDVMPAAGSDVVSAQALGAVHRLAAAARRDGVAARLLSEPRLDTATLAVEAPRFSAALADELALIGHRGPSEVEMRCTTYADDPGLLIRMVTKTLTAAPRALPTLPAVPLRARWVAAAAATQIREREMRRDRMVRANWVLRRLLREYGQRLVDAGQLDEVDDVFYLLVDELDALPPNVADVVARRRAEQRMLREVVPPEAFSGRWEPAVAAGGTLRGGNTLHGIGVSAGVVRGPVRVVAAETIDELQPGEILVAKVADVGYTPAFAYAAAVVTELGGPTSHAAIVAREYGVPCVVNARGAADLLANGTLIEVDGTTGDVTVLGA